MLPHSVKNHCTAAFHFVNKQACTILSTLSALL